MFVSTAISCPVIKPLHQTIIMTASYGFRMMRTEIINTIDGAPDLMRYCPITCANKNSDHSRHK